MYEDKKSCRKCGLENHLEVEPANYAWRCWGCAEPHWLGDIERIAASVFLNCPVHKLESKLQELANIDIDLFWAETSAVR